MIYINGYKLPDPDNNIAMTLEMITKNAGRSENGKLTNATRVNASQTFTWNWSKLTYKQMKDLCSAMKYNIPNIKMVEGVEEEEKFEPVSINDFKVKIRTILPCGIRTFYVYFGDQLSTTLCSKEIPNDFDITTATDSQLEEFIYWKDTRVDVVGVGYDTNINAVLIDDATTMTCDISGVVNSSVNSCTLTFSNSLEMSDGTVINDTAIASCFKIKKDESSFTSYTATINEDKNVVTITFDEVLSNGNYKIILQSGMVRNAATNGVLLERTSEFTVQV